jgi:uncharacterized membrane protein YfcA
MTTPGTLGLIQLFALGVVAASANAGTGIGWGVITMPVLLTVFRFAVPEAVALSVLGSLGYLLSVGVHHVATGRVGWLVPATLIAGSLVGGFVGAALVTVVPGAVIRLIVGAITIAVGVVLLTSVFR